MKVPVPLLLYIYISYNIKLLIIIEFSLYAGGYNCTIGFSKKAGLAFSIIKTEAYKFNPVPVPKSSASNPVPPPKKSDFATHSIDKPCPTTYTRPMIILRRIDNKIHQDFYGHPASSDSPRYTLDEPLARKLIRDFYAQYNARIVIAYKGKDFFIYTYDPVRLSVRGKYLEECICRLVLKAMDNPEFRRKGKQ